MDQLNFLRVDRCARIYDDEVCYYLHPVQQYWSCCSCKVSQDPSSYLYFRQEGRLSSLTLCRLGFQMIRLFHQFDYACLVLVAKSFDRYSQAIRDGSYSEFGLNGLVELPDMLLDLQDSTALKSVLYLTSLMSLHFRQFLSTLQLLLSILQPLPRYYSSFSVLVLAC